MKLGKNIHGTLSAIHRANGIAAYPYWVASLTKSGQVSKMDAPDRLNTARTEAEAEEIRARLVALNPGRAYTILPNV